MHAPFLRSNCCELPSTHGSLSPSDSPMLAWDSLPPSPHQSVNHSMLFCTTRTPNQRSLLFLKMRSRSSSSSLPSSLLDLTVATSSCLLLQICLIMALSLRCKHCRFVLVSGRVSLAWRPARKSCIHCQGSCKRGVRM